MRSALSIFTGASLALLATAKPEVNVYFGQHGSDSLASFCDAGGFDSVTLAYLTASPEADPATGYPASNFGHHCRLDSVYEANGTTSRLLANCTALSADIQHCQGLGKKVLLSTGGLWSPQPARNYAVTSSGNGTYFADFLWGAFGPKNASWAGPRPFDVQGGRPTVLDGFDFDIEETVGGQVGFIALLRRLRSHVSAYNSAAGFRKMIITGAPQCPLDAGWPGMASLVSATVFDKLYVQFYNNDLCGADSPGFNYAEWETYISGGASHLAKLFVGLPASSDTAGFVDAAAANRLVDSLRNHSSFGGVMVQDVALAKDNAVAGVPLNVAIYDHLNHVPLPTVSVTDTSEPPYPTASTYSPAISATGGTARTTGTAAASASVSSVSAWQYSQHSQHSQQPVTSTETLTTLIETSTVWYTETSSSYSPYSPYSSFASVVTVTTSALNDGLPSTTQSMPSHTYSPVSGAPKRFAPAAMAVMVALWVVLV